MISLAMFLGMRPIPRSDVERPFCLMEVPPEVWRRYDSKTLTGKRGPNKTYVTEYVLVDGHVLENQRGKLRTIEEATGVQLREKIALRGCYVVIKGTAAEVSQALLMVEALANSSASPVACEGFRTAEEQSGKIDSNGNCMVDDHHTKKATQRDFFQLPRPCTPVSFEEKIEGLQSQAAIAGPELSLSNAPLAEMVKPPFSWEERAFQDTLRKMASANSHEPSIVALECTLVSAPTADVEHASNAKRISPNEAAWTTVPSKKQSRPPMGQPEKGVLHPLPQRACPRPKPVEIHAGGYQCSRNPASGPRWAVQRVERIASARDSSAAEDMDPDLACYIWDRFAARPKSDHCRSAQQWRQLLPHWGVKV